MNATDTVTDHPSGAEASPLRLARLTLALAVTFGAGTAWLVQQQRVAHAMADAREARRALEDIARSLHGSEDARHALAAELARRKAQEAPKAPAAVPEGLKAALARLSRALEVELKRGDARVAVSSGALRVDLAEPLLFQPGQPGLSGRGTELLARISGSLGPLSSGGQVQVTASADARLAATKLDPARWQLALGRALAVATFLGSRGKVSAHPALVGARAGSAEASSAAGALGGLGLTLEIRGGGGPG